VTASLQGLGASSAADDASAPVALVRRLYVLESLATVKSPLILTELLASADTRVAAAAEAALVALFSALFDAVRGDGSKTVEAHAAEVMCAGFDELAALPSALLEPVLVKVGVKVAEVVAVNQDSFVMMVEVLVEAVVALEVKVVLEVRVVLVVVVLLVFIVLIQIQELSYKILQLMSLA
jgi:hypothetical protein